MKIDSKLLRRVFAKDISMPEAFRLQAELNAGIAPDFQTPNSDLSRHSLQATPELQTLNSELRTLNCTQAKAAVEAVRADIEANGPDALRDLLHQTDALLDRMTHWTKCQRAARYRSLLAAHAASRQAAPRRHEDTKNPNENPAQRREAPGAARSSIPFVPSRLSGSLIPDSRPFAAGHGIAKGDAGSIRGYDLVIPLGTGSKHDNLELRHLLRSALLHLAPQSEIPNLKSEMPQGLRRIHIIGPKRPAWLADHPMIRWHQWKTLKPKNHDIVAKFIHAANHPDVAETFIGTCDDFLFLARLSPGNAEPQLGLASIPSNQSSESNQSKESIPPDPQSEIPNLKSQIPYGAVRHEIGRASCRERV